MFVQETAKRVSIQFTNREEIVTPVKETKWQKFFRECKKLPAPTTISYVDNPLVITVTASVEDKGVYVILWMTKEGATPLRDAGVSLEQLCLPLDGCIFIQVPKALLTIHGDETSTVGEAWRHSRA